MYLFFVQLIFEIPSTILLRFLGPTRYLALSLIIWRGITVSSRKFSQLNCWQNRSKFALKGMVQSDFFTGTIIYFSSWYCKKEQIMRFAIFFEAVCAAGVLDGILVRRRRLNGSNRCLSLI